MEYVYTFTHSTFEYSWLTSITQLMLPTLFRPRHRSRINYGADSQRLPKLRASPYIWSHTTTPSRLIFWGSSSEPNSKLLKIPWRIFRNVVGKSIHMGVTRSAAQFMRFTIREDDLSEAIAIPPLLHRTLVG